MKTHSTQKPLGALPFPLKWVAEVAEVAEVVVAVEAVAVAANVRRPTAVAVERDRVVV